tara:strand:+ start:1185 stop:2132 length:948 start_codon:yes stop_codon:yes gene_type:complete
MKDGDEVLIVEGSKIRFLGRVAGKLESASLSQELWKNLRGERSEGWDLVYFLANPKQIDLQFSHFCELFGYEQNYQLRGFTSVAQERLEEFYRQYDDLYSVLSAIRDGFGIQKTQSDSNSETTDPDSAPFDEDQSEQPDEVAPPPEGHPSEHLEMQWRLLQMGRNAGESVWAPRNDQSRIESGFGFSQFETTFAAGLDTQVKYVENIDVVWKQQFRIDAAFEVENSTSIYSGLLRFADLTMIAPNSHYPMFIVAPQERRNRVREQLIRPTFRSLNLSEKVRYLSYDRLREIDDFFDGGKGLTVELLDAKAERLDR